MEAVLAGAAVLAAGVLLAFLIRRLSLSLGDSVTFLALLLLPLLTVGVVSGVIRLKSISGGGLSAEFLEVADNSVDAIPIAVDDAEFIAKSDTGLLLQVAQDIPPGKPIAVTLKLGLSFYTEDAIRTYIQVFSAKDPEMSVVVIDSNGKYVASAKGAVVAPLLGGLVGQRFMQALTGNSARDMLNIPGFSDKSIAETDTNIKALKKMEAENTSRLVATASDGVPKGIVLRDKIVAQLLVGLASDKR